MSINKKTVSLEGVINAYNKDHDINAVKEYFTADALFNLNGKPYEILQKLNANDLDGAKLLIEQEINK